MHTVFLAILFAVVGALCGILVTKTYSGANFVPSSGCSVVGSSVVPNGGGLFTDDFANATRFSAMWTIVSVSGGDSIGVTANPGTLTCLSNSTSSWLPVPQTPVAEASSALSGDFEFSIDWSRSDSGDFTGFRIVFKTDSNNFVQLKTFPYLGSFVMDIDWRLSGSDSQSRLYVSYFYSGQVRIKRVGNDWTFYHRESSGQSWQTLVSASCAIGATPKLQLGALNVQNKPNVVAQFDNLTFAVGGPPAPYDDSVFTVCDAGAQTIRAGASFAFDRATFAATTTGSPTLTFRTSDQDADGAPSWSSSKTLSQLQAEANSGKRFMAIEVTASNNGLSYQFDQLAVDTYNLDVTPPGVPAIDWVMALSAGAGFAVSITEPTDPDYAYCEAEVKLNSGAWQNVDQAFGLGGTGYMKFASATTDPQPAGQINQASFARLGYQVGDTVTVRVRAVDGSGNASAWVTSSPLVLTDAQYVPVFVDAWYADWQNEAWTTSWFTHGDTTEVIAVLQETIGTSWNPVCVVRNIPGSAGNPGDFTCTWGLKKYADDAAMLIGPVTGTCVLGTDGVSWELTALVSVASQAALSPALSPGRYVMAFRIANADQSQVREFVETLELLPGVVA